MGHDLEMGRPKNNDFPANMTFHKRDRRYIVRNPLTKKEKGYADEATARAVVEKLNAWLAAERELRALTHGRPTITGLVEKWIEDRLPFMPWAPSTRGNMVAKMNRISRELGHRLIERTDCMYIEDWISRIAKTGDTFNDWRYAFVLLWKFAVSRKLADSNEPERIEERSTSKKLEMNQKQRQPLALEGFKAIHKVADKWMQLAMEFSLVTLLSRLEVCNCALEHFRDDFLFVIRQKSSAASDMAFIKIRLTAQLEEFKSRSLLLDASVSPFLIHRMPDWRKREQLDSRPHWTYITPDYLSKEFARLRDLTKLWAHLEPRQCPTFHEVRGLGARLYEEAGMDKGAITALMTHSDPKTTEIYLGGGAAALKDSDFKPVAATLNVKNLLAFPVVKAI